MHFTSLLDMSMNNNEINIDSTTYESQFMAIKLRIRSQSQAATCVWYLKFKINKNCDKRHY